MRTPPETLRKLYAMATHPATPEHEREQARKALKKLLAKYNMEESDLDSEALIPYEFIAISKAKWSLMLHVFWEVAGVIEHKNSDAWKTAKRGQYKVVIRMTLMTMNDFRACLAWYEDMLNEDLSNMRAALKKTRSEAKERIRLAQETLKAVPNEFVAKYRIGYEAMAARSEQLARERKEKEAAGNASVPATPAKQKRLTKAEEEKLDREWQARRNARNGLGDGERWEKGEGLAAGTRELGNGQTFQLSND